MRTKWYREWFGNEYLTLYSHRDEKEAQTLISLIHRYIELSPRSRILDLCCGQGRHAHLLAKEGYRVIGMDLSRTLLTVAKFKNDTSQRAHFIQADMRFLPSRSRFDLLLNLFTSFGYFETDVENQRVFCQFNQVLKEGAFFVFDYFNAGHVVNHLVPSQKERLGDILVEQERYIRKSTVKKKITLYKKSDTSVYYESVKMYQPDEIYVMLSQAGLKIEHIFGDYDGTALTPDSPRLLIMGKKQS